MEVCGQLAAIDATRRLIRRTAVVIGERVQTKAGATKRSELLLEKEALRRQMGGADRRELVALKERLAASQ
jgi:hypothetical protein